jgi:WD40 repeat protein/tetratricopeptide (TPR) repeat protein
MIRGLRNRHDEATMSRIDCPNQDTLSDFVLGKLAIHAQGTVAEHLDACTECEQRAGELDAMADGVVSVLRRISGPVPGAGDDMTEAAGPGSNAGGDMTAVAHPHHAGDLASSTERWGEFRIVREIGRGGMGVVCEAFQGSLNRHVALKFLPAHGNLARFRREAQAAGRLHHTNIVPVFGVGEQDGRHFYVMQYIAGRSLDAVLKERAEAAGGSGRSSGRRGAQEAARIGSQVAGALAYAHGQGVIHRDIKPSNLLLDDQGAVWVTDFGLAKVADQQDLTGTGDVLGTLRYMPPEAFEGRYDARGDIYALGLTLYELLALRAAYNDADRARLIRLVTAGDPPRLRELDRAVPHDLETVIHKAIERDPAHRYPTAAQLADDLVRFLEDRPVLARRTGPLGQALRWCRRNKAVAALLAALVLVFVGGFAGVTVQWLRADAEATRANTMAQAEAEARTAESKLRVRAQSEIAERNLDHALDFARRGDVDYALLWMAEALEQVPAERPEIARMLRANLGGWEGQVLRRRAVLDQPAHVSPFARFRPDGRVILTASDKGTARFWEAATGRPLGPPLKHVGSVTSCAFSPDGRLAATGDDEASVRVWDSSTGQAVGPTLNHRRSLQIGGVDLLDFSCDGRLLVSSDLQVGTKLWDVASGRRLELPKDVEMSHVTRFSPDGRRLYLIDRKARQARTWDRATGQMVGPTIASDRLHWACWSPDGRLIVTGNGDETGQVWDVATGRLVASLPEADNHFNGATFSPDGRWLLTYGNDRTARIWDVVNRRPVGMAAHHDGQINAATFSPDGRLILTAADFVAQLWDRATGRSIGAPLRHQGPINDVSFSPDGRLVLTASEDETAHVTDISRNELLPLSDRAEHPERAAGISAAPLPGILFPDGQFSPDGSRVLLTDHARARLVEIETGQPIGPPVVSRWRYAHVAIFSPDGRRIATYSHDFPYGDGGSTWSTCQVRDAGTGRPVSPLLPHGNWVSVMAFSPDGKVLATGDYSGVVHRWDVKTGAMIGRPFAAGGIVFSLAFSPDGRLLAAGSASPGNQVVLWDLESGSGRQRGDPVRFTNLVGHLAFSQDGTRLAAASGDHTVRIIETIDGRAAVIIRLNGRPRTLTFTPDGCHILTSGDHMDAPSARLWDAQTGEPVAPPASQSRIVSTSPAYLPGFATFAIGNGDGTIRLWDIATARSIGAGWRLRQPCRAVSVGGDGRSLTAVDQRGNVRTWPIPLPATGSVEGLVRHLRARTGHELDSSKTIVAIELGVWKSIRDEAGDARPTTDAADEQVWHEACARDAETMGDAFGARWHLDRLIAARPGTGLLHARRARTWLWSGDVSSAGDDFDRAIALGPRDRVLDWMLHCAEDSSYDRRPVDAVRVLDLVVAARPDDWLTFALRAEHLIKLGRVTDREADLERAIERGAEITFLIRIADERSRAGRWAEAARTFDRAIAMGTVPYEVWMQAATAHLEIGDEPGFRRLCDKMRAWAPAEIFERWVAASLVDLATLGPGGVGDDAKLFGWIEPSLPSVAPAQKQWKRGLLQILGAVHFRAGKYSEAIARLKESIAVADGAVAPEVAAFMAMAHFRMGEPAKARAQLGVPWRDEPDSPTAEDWWAWRGRRLLRAEAEAVVLYDPIFPANPFAH